MKNVQVNNKIKISKTIRNILIISLIVIVFFAFFEVIRSIRIDTNDVKQRKEIYKYTNKGDLDAKVNLKDNQYIEQDEVIEGQVYLSDLISNIDMNVIYDYTGSKNDEVSYDYKVEAIINAAYAGTRETYDILNKAETLKEVKDQKGADGKISIKDSLSIDYEQYHQMMKNFKKAMSITADSNLIVKFTVNTYTKIGNKDVRNQYVVDYKISLGDKVALIEKVNKNKEVNVIEDEIKVSNPGEVRYDKLIINIAIIVIALLTLKAVLSKTEELRVIRNEFKIELNKILKSYEDKIVEIQDLHNIDVENATTVKDIVQIRKLAEEALVPIYCYVKDEKEAYFIVTKYENSYIYILK